ncbi:MAG: redoxin domain-containing protein [Bacteroidales bacterium]|nr:redoxin domain-containing protein [Bacteroidales bacterium]
MARNKLSLTITLILLLIMEPINAQEYKSLEDAKGLMIGVKAPSFSAIDSKGIEFSLNEALTATPVVVIFYRGYWCPVCNKHLGQIQDSLQLIYEKGATLVAISPEKPEYLNKMSEKSGAAFTLLYDEDYKIAEAFDVSFLPEEKQLFVYNTVLNAKLKKTHSDDSQRLPIPATYIINQDGIIIWRQFDANYKNRSNVSEILEVLQELNQ